MDEPRPPKLERDRVSRDDFAEQYRELRRILLAVQWKGSSKRCPWCGAGEGDHQDDCELSAVLAINLDNIRGKAWSPQEGGKSFSFVVSARQLDVLKDLAAELAEHGHLRDFACLWEGVRTAKSLQASLRTMRAKGIIDGVARMPGSTVITPHGQLVLRKYDKGES